MTLKYRNFKAWIYCQDTGEILEEYKAGPDPEDDRVYICWIASEAGRRFTVHWESVLQNVCDNRGVVSVDGTFTDNYVNFKNSRKISASRGVKTATGKIRPYEFSDIVLTDDDRYLGVEQSSNIDELGNITVEIYRVRAHYKHLQRPKPPRRPRQKVELYDGAIHETSKKMFDHRITLGEAEPFGRPRQDRPRTRKLVWEYDDQDDNSPHVTFKFRYRPRAFLQAEGIVPMFSRNDTRPDGLVHIHSYMGDGRAMRHRQESRRPLIAFPGQNIVNDRLGSDLASVLPSPSLLRETPGPAYGIPGLRCLPATPEPEPEPVKQDEEVVFLGFSQRKVGIKRGNENPLLRRVRQKRDSRIREKRKSDVPFLWVEENGVIDLTMDD